jgi:hypothetical protein
MMSLLGRASRLPRKRDGRKSEASKKVVSIYGKRTLSAAARKKIAAAQKARWARLKAGKKTT